MCNHRCLRTRFSLGTSEGLSYRVGVMSDRCIRPGALLRRLGRGPGVLDHQVGDTHRSETPPVREHISPEVWRRLTFGGAPYTHDHTAGVIHHQGKSGRRMTSYRVNPTVPQHRAYIAERSSGFLPPDARIRHIFGAQCFSPWLPALLYLPWGLKWRVVAVCQDAIYVLDASLLVRLGTKELGWYIGARDTTGPAQRVVPL